MIAVLEYSTKDDRFVESNIDCMVFSNIKVINCVNPTSIEIQSLSNKLNIPIEILQKSLGERERPRTTSTGPYSQIIYKAPIKRKDHLHTHSLVFFWSDNLLLIMSRHDINAVVSFLSMGDQFKMAHFQKGTAYLLYEILDNIMNDYFTYHEAHENSINYLEEDIIENSNSESIKEIFKLKKSLIYFHKALTANRDVIVALEKCMVGKADQQIVTHFRMLYNDIIHLIDIISTNREVIAGAIEIYMTSISNNLNISMKRMTAWASLILIPTFVTGLYGMNFKYMPELHWVWGYPFAIAIMIVSAMTLFLVFRKKNYF